MPLDPISDAELDAILSRNRVNGSVTMLRPLEIHMSRDDLITVTRKSLDAMKLTRSETPETPADQRAQDRAIQQRIDFLSWLSGQPEQVYMALYPVHMDGLSDDDVLDALDDQDLWPF